MQKEFAVTFIWTGSSYIFELRSPNAKLQPGKISAIGGHVEHGEKPLDALRRELFEETTIDPEIIKELDFGFLGKLVSEKGNVVHFYKTVLKSDFESTVEDTGLVSMPIDVLNSRIDEFTYFTGRAIREFSGLI